MLPVVDMYRLGSAKSDCVTLAALGCLPSAAKVIINNSVGGVQIEIHCAGKNRLAYAKEPMARAWPCVADAAQGSPHAAKKTMDDEAGVVPTWHQRQNANGDMCRVMLSTHSCRSI